MKFLIPILLLLSCTFPQREQTVYYIFTFENAAGYEHRAITTKRLFDSKLLDLRPEGYRCIEFRACSTLADTGTIVDSGGIYEY